MNLERFMDEETIRVWCHLSNRGHNMYKCKDCVRRTLCIRDNQKDKFFKIEKLIRCDKCEEN